MKVIYKTAVAQQILDAIMQAEKDGSKITNIFLDAAEWDELSICRHPSFHLSVIPRSTGVFHGVPVERE